MARTDSEITSSREHGHATVNLKLLLDRMSDGVLLVDLSGICAYANPRLARILKKETIESLVDMPIWEIIPAFDQRWLSMMSEVRIFSDHMVIATEESKDLVVDIQADVIEAGDSEVIQIILEHNENQSRIERALVQTLHTLLSHVPGVVYRAANNPKWDLLYITDQVEALTGYSVIEFMTGEQTFGGIIHPDDRQRVWDAVQLAIADHTKFELTYRIITKSGEIRWFWEHGSPSDDATQKELEVIEGFITDITSQHLAENALRESETRYRMLAENVKDVIWTMDLQGQLTYVSPASDGLCGYVPEEMMALSLSEIWLPESAARLRIALKTVEASPTLGKDLRQFELQQRCKDGSVIWVEVVINTLLDQQDLPTGVVGVSRNITQRRNMEFAEREQRLLAETLRETINSLSETLESDIVMRRILEYVGRVVPHDAANIMLIEGNRVYVQHAEGYPSRVEGIVYDLTLSNLAEMYKTQQPLIIPDTREYPQWLRETKLEWIRSYVGAPILVHGQVIGFLNLDKAEKDYYDERHGVVLQVFAKQAAVAIRNAQVYEELSDRARELSILHRASSFLISPIKTTNSLESVGQQIVDAVVNTFEQVDCGLMIIDREQKVIKRLVRSGSYEVRASHILKLDGEGLVPEAVRRGMVMYAPDVRTHPAYVVGEPRTLSELVIPLVGQQGVIGVLDLQSLELNAFLESDQRLLEHFAQRAATVIENVQLFHELDTANQELERRVEERTVALRQATRRIETIFNTNNDAIVLAETDGTIQQVNPAFRYLFGYEDEELFGINLTTFIAPVDRQLVQTSLESLGRDVATARLEIGALYRDGEPFDADMVLSYVEDPTVSGVVCSFRDMTDYKQAEAALRSALERERELSELKTRFLSMASHDFRTPLTTILSSANLLKLHFEHLFDEAPPEKMAKHFRRIDTAIAHMTSLLDDILIIGRVEAGKLRYEPAKANLYELCRGLLDDIRHLLIDEQLFVLDYSSNCPKEMIFDAKLMRQMLNNLLSNAIKYSPEGGEVKLQVACDAEQLHIAVVDHGLGIPSKDQDHLFEMFHRAENVKAIQGTGLGLAIVKRAAELHDGSVTFKSMEGEGSTFSLHLPLNRGES